jgi:hypothetical protein
MDDRMSTMHVKPARPGLIVRMPEDDYRPMPDEGVLVEWSPYYTQCLRHGDLVRVEPKPEPDLFTLVRTSNDA